MSNLQNSDSNATEALESDDSITISATVLEDLHDVAERIGARRKFLIREMDRAWLINHKVTEAEVAGWLRKIIAIEEYAERICDGSSVAFMGRDDR